MLRRLIRDRGERDAVAASVAAALHPAPRGWILARIASLLASYPTYGETPPEGAVRLDAQDWAAILDGLPQWSIDRAVRWWRGPDNDWRGRKPQPGDIAARARLEIGPFRVGQKAVERFDAGTALPGVAGTTSERRVTAEQAERMIKQAGFAVRRMQ